MTTKATSILVSFLVYLFLGLSIMAQKAGIENLFISYYLVMCFLLGLGLLGFPILAILVVFYDKIILPRIRLAQTLEATEMRYSKAEYERRIHITWIFSALVIGLMLLTPLVISDSHERIVYPVCFSSGIYVYAILSGFFMKTIGYKYEERMKVLKEMKKTKKIGITRRDFYQVGFAFILIAVIVELFWNLVLDHRALAAVLIPLVTGISFVSKGVKTRS